jgi:hypothetical protein
MSFKVGAALASSGLSRLETINLKKNYYGSKKHHVPSSTSRLFSPT